VAAIREGDNVMDKKPDRRHLLAPLAAERAALLEGLLGLDESSLTERPVFDDWTVKDILAHIAAWDRWEERTMRSMVNGEAPDFSAVKDFAVSSAAFVTEWRDRSLDEVLAELTAARHDWVACVESLPDEEFYRPRSYFGHTWTFSEIPLQIQWRHDAEHAEQIVNWRDAEALRSEFRGHVQLLLAALHSARDELLMATALVSAGEREPSPVCGEWTVKDVLGHVADWEWYGVEGLRQMTGDPAAGQPSELEPVDDVDAWNRAHALARRDQPWDTVWDDLHAARQAFLAVLAGINRAAMARSFLFPWGGAGTPYQWMGAYVAHDREHARDLRQSGGVGQG
jgi:uncharacterized damage-inducible protein DinB